MTTTPTPPWAIVTLRVSPDRSTREAWSATLVQLEEAAACIAAIDGVSGVETRDPRDPGGPAAPEMVVYTTPEQLLTVQARAERLVGAFGLAAHATGEVRTDDDWRDAWKQFYRKTVLGDGQLLLRPSWLPREDGDPAVELVLDPGRAFGTGLHETTQLCLDRVAVIARAPGPPPRRVLDLGCGSGILALVAARLLPRAEVLAVDDDPEATATTHENAIANGLESRLQIRTGDVDAVDDASFDLVLANIRAHTLIPRAAALARCTRPGGVVVLSGVLDDERDAVAAAYRGVGFVHDPDISPWPRQRGEWVALDLRRGP